MSLNTTVIPVTFEGLTAIFYGGDGHRNGCHSDGAGAAICCAADCSGLYLTQAP